MNYKIIREIKESEMKLLDTFLYEAIFIPEGVQAPSLSISPFSEYRNLGIGTELMKRILLRLKEQEYKQVSLSVQKANYAVRMYKNVGFEVAHDNEKDYIMICKL